MTAKFSHDSEEQGPCPGTSWRPAHSRWRCSPHPPRTRRPTPISREIRDEIRQLKESYEARIQALEQRLKDAEAQDRRRAARPPRRRRRCTRRAAPRRSRPRAGGAAVRHQRVQSRRSRRCCRASTPTCRRIPNKYAIHGFAPSGDIAPAKRGFCIAESELALSANVDDKFSGNLIFSLAPDNTVEVEEAYGMLTALPNGLTPKFGRFLSGIGYLNDQHQHVWDFYDAPLAVPGVPRRPVHERRRAAEMGRADRHVPRVRRARSATATSFPGTERNKNGIGERRRLRARRRRHRREQQLARGPLVPADRGRSDREYTQTDLAGNDAQLALLRHEPASRSPTSSGNRRPTATRRTRNFKLQGEYFWRRETRRSHLRRRRRARPHADVGATRRARAAGTSQGVYQFMPYWRVGARYDRLDPGTRRLRRQRRLPRARRRSIRSATR